MTRTVRLHVDGRELDAPEGVTLAAVLLDAGVRRFRSSMGGEPRAPLCGMGICFECLVTVDGVPRQRACLVSCADGMIVTTGEGA